MSHDDQRMRELANRLVAMAPEPPPFPEEEVMLTTPSKPTRLRPALAFVGAALLVLVGAAIPLLLNQSNGDQPVATTVAPPVDTTGAPNTTSAPATTEPTAGTTMPTDTTEPPAANVMYETAVFLVQDPENSFLGNPALVPFWTEIEAPEGSSVELLRLQLLTRPEFSIPTSHFYNAIPEGVEFLDIAYEETAIVLEVNEGFRAGAGGLLADLTMLNQIIYTATYMTDSDLVHFLIDGQAITDFGTDGLDLSGGVSLEDFRDSLNSVLVTQPIYVGDGLPQLTGVANVFEATVSLEIVDPSGEVVYQDFTTASCGTGCWGEYSFSLDTPALTPDNLVRVFWNSPEDGSRRDVVYVPFGEEAVWDLLVES